MVQRERAQRRLRLVGEPPGRAVGAAEWRARCRNAGEADTPSVVERDGIAVADRRDARLAGGGERRGSASRGGKQSRSGQGQHQHGANDAVVRHLAV